MAPRTQRPERPKPVALPLAAEPPRYGLMAIAALLALVAALWASQALAQTTEEALRAAIASDIRTDAERARDRNRRPMETLKFFGFEKDMRVVELFPSSGWYAKLLAPVLRDNGEYYAVGGLGEALGFGADLVGAKDLKGMDRIKQSSIADSLSPSEHRGIVDADSIDLQVDEADLILTFRNLHNMSPGARAAFFKAAYKSLRPGGRLGAIDHTRRHMEADAPENWRRLDPIMVVREATAAGFHLLDYSTLHFRADDELEYEVGRRSVRGNTDRWTLLFEK